MAARKRDMYISFCIYVYVIHAIIIGLTHIYVLWNACASVFDYIKKFYGPFYRLHQFQPTAISGTSFFLLHIYYILFLLVSPSLSTSRTADWTVVVDENSKWSCSYQQLHSSLLCKYGEFYYIQLVKFIYAAFGVSMPRAIFMCNSDVSVCVSDHCVYTRE